MVEGSGALEALDRRDSPCADGAPITMPQPMNLLGVIAGFLGALAALFANVTSAFFSGFSR